MWAKKMAKAQRPEAAEHMWGHLRRLRVCRVEEGEVGEAGLDRQRQVVCARLGRVHFTLSIGFTSLHLASWSPKSQRPLFLQTDVSTWIIPEHTCSEQGRKKGLSLCFLIARGRRKQPGRVVTRLWGQEALVHVLAPPLLHSVSRSKSFSLPLSEPQFCPP